MAQQKVLIQYQQKMYSSKKCTKQLFDTILQNREKIEQWWVDNDGDLSSFLQTSFKLDYSYLQELINSYAAKSCVEEYLQELKNNSSAINQDEFKKMTLQVRDEVIKILEGGKQSIDVEQSIISRKKSDRSDKNQAQWKKRQEMKKNQEQYKKRQEMNKSQIQQKKCQEMKKGQKSHMIQEQNLSIKKSKVQKSVLRQSPAKINQNNIIATVKFIQSKVDLNYTHLKYNLKEQLSFQINRRLAEIDYIIEVYQPVTQIRIMDDSIYEKSKDAGNYRFDPFHDSIRIYLSQKDKQPFQRSFKINKKIQVRFQAEKNNQFDIMQSLTSRDSVQKLINLVGIKIGCKQDQIKTVIRVLKEGNAVKNIGDLFAWTDADFKKQNLKLTFIYQIIEMIQRIKDSKNESASNKKIKNQKLQCLRTGNSHKILRYVVFKVHGEQELQKLAKLNYQNLLKAVNIVKKQIINEQLLMQLQDFLYQFADIPNASQKLSISRGMILFGPPGTGKTQLTQSLPNLIGFHLIQKGLSAADFMKSLVGESSRTIRDLVNRASLSPYLICSVGIDQVDGLVPDRKDKQQKNKGQGISMLLSVIQGNKDVPNLIFMTSTNHLLKIDEAIRRRLSGQFQVGRPNPNARKKIILDDQQYLEKHEEILQYLVLITSNFTGAALKSLNSALTMKLKKKKLSLKTNQCELTISQFTNASKIIAKQFSITLGLNTFPQIYENKGKIQYFLSMNFLNQIARQFMIIIKDKNKQNNKFKVYYSNKIQKIVYNRRNKENKLEYQFQMDSDTLKISNYDYRAEQRMGQDDHYLYVLQNWANKLIKDVIVCQIDKSSIRDFQKILRRNYESPTLMIIKQSISLNGSIIIQDKLFQKPIKNLYILKYVESQNELNYMFGSLGWVKNYPHKYSGRIIVELNQDDPKMAFELDTPITDQIKLHNRYFLKTQKKHSPNDVIPQLVQFFKQRQSNYVLLIDQELFLQNGAFQQQKKFEIIQQRILEASNYSHVSLIFDVDSIIGMSKSISDSSMGRSQSYNVSDQNMFKLILHYLREFAVVTRGSQHKKQKWVTAIIRDPQMALLIKRQLMWPLTREQKQKKKQEKDLDEERKCIRCHVYYTERDNLNQRKCMQHPGPIINLQNRRFEDILSIQQAKIEELKYKQKDQKTRKYDSKFMFACCQKGIYQQGQFAYKHITKEEQGNPEEELNMDRNNYQNINKWEGLLMNL